mmetsp:Transcript_18668/g.47716  ORF Transcript_18668/g.47716 Transcript_18668/m.47716 type:complete len:260 (+) Transcript_18668:1053-1832(+)
MTSSPSSPNSTPLTATDPAASTRMTLPGWSRRSRRSSWRWRNSPGTRKCCSAAGPAHKPRALPSPLPKPCSIRPLRPHTLPSSPSTVSQWGQARRWRCLRRPHRPIAGGRTAIASSKPRGLRLRWAGRAQALSALSPAGCPSKSSRGGGAPGTGGAARSRLRGRREFPCGMHAHPPTRRLLLFVSVLFAPCSRSMGWAAGFSFLGGLYNEVSDCTFTPSMIVDDATCARHGASCSDLCLCVQLVQVASHHFSSGAQRVL